MNERNKLMRMIQQYSFVLYETALYLDTHPHCRRALEYYQRYNCKMQEAKERYERLYGPLTIFGNTCGDTWNWVIEPWPWEYDCQ